MKAVRNSGFDLLRMWRPIISGRPPAGRIGLAIRAFFSGRTPDEHVRDESVRLIRHAVEKGTGGRVGRAPAGYPHGRTLWEMAAKITSMEWRSLVTGRRAEKSE